MATGWAHEGAVLEQIDATVQDAVARARSSLSVGQGLAYCANCRSEIPQRRREAVPGARYCLDCQQTLDSKLAEHSGYNRRGSKDSQLR